MAKMSHRKREEERIERIIRGLLRLPENKRCVNCNLLGPQYVCTTFWTFVCTSCSGIQRKNKNITWLDITVNIALFMYMRKSLQQHVRKTTSLVFWNLSTMQSEKLLKGSSGCVLK